MGICPVLDAEAKMETISRGEDVYDTIDTKWIDTPGSETDGAKDLKGFMIYHYRFANAHTKVHHELRGAQGRRNVIDQHPHIRERGNYLGAFGCGLDGDHQSVKRESESSGVGVPPPCR